jgi:hypothetical protein
VGGQRLRCGPRPWPRRSGPLGPLEPGARSQRGGVGGGCALALAAVYKPPPPFFFYKTCSKPPKAKNKKRYPVLRPQLCPCGSPELLSPISGYCDTTCGATHRRSQLGLRYAMYQLPLSAEVVRC